MEPIKFKEQNTVYAENQEEYMPLPAHQARDPSGTVICCWKLTEKEIEEIVKTGVIWHAIMTFDLPLQPQLLTVESPFVHSGE